MTLSDDRKFRIQVLSAGTGAVLFLCALIWFFAPKPPVVRAEIQRPAPATEERMGQPAEPVASPTVATSRGDSGEAGAAVPAPAAPLAVSKAQASYQRFCTQCHGDDGKGDTQMARMMSVKPTNLRTGPFRAGRTKAEVAALIRKGKGRMPGFSEELSESDALLLADYVLSFEGKGG